MSVCDNPTASEALSGPFKHKWKEAMKCEFNSLVNENAWEFVERTKHKKKLLIVSRDVKLNINKQG